MIKVEFGALMASYVNTVQTRPGKTWLTNPCVPKAADYKLNLETIELTGRKRIIRVTG